MIDIKIYGLRNKVGAYETGKLFAINITNATTFGKNNYAFDTLPNTIIKVKIPIYIYQKSTHFEADGMQVVFIEKEYLNLLQAENLKNSQI